MDQRAPQLEYSRLEPEMHNEAGRRHKAAKIRAVLQHFRGTGDLAGARVADLGCSTGFIAEEMHRAGASTVGIDIDLPGLLGAAARLAPRIGLACADGQRLPLADASVDIVIFNHVYEHVVDPDAAVRELVRVLAPGGLAYLALGNRWQVVEPHHGLPFLSWLPSRLADRYVRAARGANGYHERFRGRHGLRRMAGALSLWDYTETILANPEQFAADDMVPPAMRRVPPRAWRLAQPLMPTFIWVGAKGPAAPAGPRLRPPPRRLGAGWRLRPRATPHRTAGPSGRPPRVVSGRSSLGSQSTRS